MTLAPQPTGLPVVSWEGLEERAVKLQQPPWLEHLCLEVSEKQSL